MFDNMLVVSTAVSSFNNAALFGPFFMVVGLLSLPLFFMVYIYGNDFVSRFGWNRNNFDNQISFWSSLSLLLWLLLFGGNYAVIRDGISLLPLFLSVILFVLMIVVTQKSVQLHYIDKLRDKRWVLFMLFVLIAMVFFAGDNNYFNLLLQISAIVCGFAVGRNIKRNIQLMPWPVVVMGILMVLVLMQPEFFRFGQLGNLTPIHWFAIICAGVSAITAVTTKYVRPSGKIHQSAYIKIKWFLRILSLLAFILFVSTESVPVFIGMVLSIGLLEALSIYHSKDVYEDMSKQSLSALFMIVGITIICPILTAIGVLYMAAQPKKIQMADFLRLL